MKNQVKDSVHKILTNICQALPIKQNKIFFESYYGSQYGCNPKYISEWITNHTSGNEFDVVWCLNNPIDITGVRVVRNRSLRYFYELATAKVIVTNFRTTIDFKKRMDQYYIQTWHSSLRLKQIEKDVEESLSKQYIHMAKMDSPKIDLLLSGCQVSTEIFNRAFWYKGEIFEAGSPRNDLFFMNNVALLEKIKNNLGISLETKIVLYAPTFRKNPRLDYYQLDFGNLTTDLNERFDGEWVCLVKLHPHLMNFSKQLTEGANVLDVTDYPDIQELLYISDVLISDYSSLMFDYALTKRPCFLYMSDYKEYTSHDRGLYFDLLSLPFISVFNQQELSQEIHQFNQENYEQEVVRFLNQVGSFEDGRCCERVVERIREVCYGGTTREKI